MLYENSRTRRQSLSRRFWDEVPMRAEPRRRALQWHQDRNGARCAPDKSWLISGFRERNKRLRNPDKIPSGEIIIFYCGNVIQCIQWWLLTWHISRSDFLAQEQPCFFHRASRTAHSGLPLRRARPCRFSARRPSSTLISDSRSTRKRARLPVLRPRRQARAVPLNAPLPQICHLPLPQCARMRLPGCMTL